MKLPRDITIQALEQQRQIQSLKQTYSFIGIVVLLIAFAISIICNAIITQM